jgi:hypothetical protein
MDARDGKRRYPRKIAAWPAWVRFHRSARYLPGRTRNVSRGGAYIAISLDDAIEPGEPVEFIFEVTEGKDGEVVIQTVSGEASVVRVEKGPDGGLALRFDAEKDIP